MSFILISTIHYNGFLIEIFLPGLFTGRGCYRCEVSVHEAVVVHCEWIVMKQMW